MVSRVGKHALYIELGSPTGSPRVDRIFNESGSGRLKRGRVSPTLRIYKPKLNPTQLNLSTDSTLELSWVELGFSRPRGQPNSIA